MLLVVAPVFLGLLPFLVVWVGRRLDLRCSRLPIRGGALKYLFGGLLMVLGFSVAFWSVATQLTRGRGTPLPVMPTQELLTDGPYRSCRNPMTLGAILAYLGIAVGAGTMSGVFLVAGFAALLVAYLKGLEEKELDERFGEAYKAYRRTVPFIIPRVPRRR